MPNLNPLAKASDFDPDILQLFDQYVHGVIDRRGFMAKAGASGAALLAALSPDFARAQKVSPSDARLKIESLEFASPQGYGKGRAYVARPASASGALPVVLVIHENRGLNPHIEDIARRLALDGYIAVAPDVLYTLGGYPGDEDKARELFGKVEQAKATEDFVAAAHTALKLPGASGKLGAVGFCWGGGMVNTVATRVPELLAAVPFYGIAPPLDQVPKIKAQLLTIYAGEDPRVDATWPPYEAALKSAGLRYETRTFPGVQHGFNNDTTPRFDEKAAAEAWAMTMGLFGRTLKTA